MLTPFFWKRASLAAVLLLASACNILPIPTPQIPTAIPMGPTPTPLTPTVVTFNVRLPANTPVGAAPVVQIMDDVGGNHITVPLIGSSGGLWTGGVAAPVGAVLRYKYVRPQPAYVEEATPALKPVPYRLLVVTSASMTTEDIVAAWLDTPFAGDTGALAGTVKNSNTGSGVMGVIVSAGGRLTLTAWDGSYQFADVPVGVQRVAVLAPDGSLRPAQGTVTINKGQTTTLDLASDDPNLVTITFLARPPVNTDPTAPLRLAGSVSQMGATFAPGPDGTAIAAAREPALVRLADGRWGTQIQLYEGTLIRYKYTLGDGVWNGELDATGAKRLRQIVVPLTDATIEDSIDAWHSGASAPVTFEVTTPVNTPPNDVVAIQFRTGAWLPPVPMWRVGVNAWKFVLYNPTNMQGNVFYRYCRNFACGAADDAQTAGANATGRSFTPTLLEQDLKDTVAGWQWPPDAVQPMGVLPAVVAHPGFGAGIEFTDEWQANGYPFIGEALRGIQAAGANWVTFTPRASAQMTPSPVYAYDLASAPLLTDWKPIVDQAHTLGLRVALHPVTCHHTPYGQCDYWNGVAYSPEFWNAWFAAYEKYIVTQAELAARAGADLLVVGGFKLRPSFPGEPEAPADAEARWRNLIGNVRAHFKGPIAFELLMGQSVWPSPPAFLDAVDVIRIFWWAPLSGGPTPTVNDLAINAGGFLDTRILPVQQRFQRGVLIVPAYLSADQSATQCLKRDDGQCYSFEDFNPDRLDAARYTLDLQEQADIYNGLLTAVNSRPWIAGFFAYGYHPAAALRDKSISVRGKPAEAVLSSWYPKLQGR
jgi:hypothetical protein